MCLFGEKMQIGINIFKHQTITVQFKRLTNLVSEHNAVSKNNILISKNLISNFNAGSLYVFNLCIVPSTQPFLLQVCANQFYITCKLFVTNNLVGHLKVDNLFLQAMIWNFFSHNIGHFMTCKLGSNYGITLLLFITFTS